MNDEQTGRGDKSGRRRPPPGKSGDAGAPAADAAGPAAGWSDEAAAALRALQNLTSETVHEAEHATPASVRPVEPTLFAAPSDHDEVTSLDASGGFDERTVAASPGGYRQPSPPPPRRYFDPVDLDPFGRPPTPVENGYRGRERGSRSLGATVARYAAPVVLLIAVLVAFSLATSAGILGGKNANVSTSTSTTSGTPTTSAKPSAKARFYVVKPGDTLSAIATKTGVSQASIKALNPKLNPSSLAVGQKIKLPPK
jgi:LysM repeat protein